MTREEVKELRERLNQADDICHSIDRLTGFINEININHSNLGTMNLNWYVNDCSTKNRDIVFAPTKDKEFDAAVKSYFIQFLCQVRASMETSLKKL